MLALPDDLAPALVEALAIGSAKVETTSWDEPDQPYRSPQLRPEDRRRRLWNTRLAERDIQLCLDRTPYP